MSQYDIQTINSPGYYPTGPVWSPTVLSTLFTTEGEYDFPQQIVKLLRISDTTCQKQVVDRLGEYLHTFPPSLSVLSVIVSNDVRTCQIGEITIAANVIITYF